MSSTYESKRNLNYVKVKIKVKDIMLIGEDFFKRSALEIAPELLGKSLVRDTRGTRLALTINEVEAYDGKDDMACHASKGKSKRNSVMYGPAGYWYVYLIYGMHCMLNIVTDRVDYPSSVFIRGTTTVSGPGRLTKELSVGLEINGKRASRENGLWIEEGIKVCPKEIDRTERVGVRCAAEWADVPYRFIWKQNRR